MTKKVNYKQEVEIVTILKENIVYEVAGWYNEVQDGYRTEQEYHNMTTDGDLLSLADWSLQEAYKDGFLTSESSSKAIEAKHIKFLGNKQIEALKEVAVGLAKIDLDLV